MKKRLFLIMSILVIFSMFLAACQPAATPEPTEEAMPEETEEAMPEETEEAMPEETEEMEETEEPVTAGPDADAADRLRRRDQRHQRGRAGNHAQAVRSDPVPASGRSPRPGLQHLALRQAHRVGH